MQTTKEKTMKTKHMSRRLRRFARANEAVSALEYAILIGVIATVVTAALITFGDKIGDALEEIGKEVAEGTAEVRNEN